jgi:hypothetical protein
MQIVHTNQLHAAKEIRKENLHRQQEERGNKNILIGDQTKCPQCSKIGRVVWVSQNKKTAGIQCSASHSMTNRPDSKFGSTARPQSKTDRNMIFLMEIK